MAACVSAKNIRARVFGEFFTASVNFASATE
jgi:hypothetical protein